MSKEAHSHANRNPVRRLWPEDREGANKSQRARVNQQLRGEIPIRRIVADRQEVEDTEAADDWVRENGGW